jgi:hypothetical protein
MPGLQSDPTAVAELIDPMTSLETAGWLLGELRAPN